MSHMFVPILTDEFNHWFAQGAIPGSITKGAIILLKKGGRHVWEDLDDYRPITLLNTELNILARVLVNRLQLVISDLIRPEQNYAVKGRSIQDNLHLVRVWKRLRSSGRSSRVASCRIFSKSLLWSPSSVGLGMGWQIRPCAESFLLAVSEQRCLRTPMISLSLCHADQA